MENNRCMKCGCITYEGRHICLTCEGTDDMQTFKRQEKLPKTNRDKIANTAIYDLLCRIQKNAEERKNLQNVLCVLSNITNQNPLFRCAGYFQDGKHNCNSCIADWLNEPYDGRW